MSPWAGIYNSSANCCFQCYPGVWMGQLKSNTVTKKNTAQLEGCKDSDAWGSRLTVNQAMSCSNSEQLPMAPKGWYSSQGSVENRKASGTLPILFPAQLYDTRAYSFTGMILDPPPLGPDSTSTKHLQSISASVLIYVMDKVKRKKVFHKSWHLKTNS